MVELRFINDSTPIHVEAEQQETSIGLQSENQATEINISGLAHSDLSGRDLPDQHPISAITGLQDILNKVWTFTFEQELASDTWVINHNLGRSPSVDIVDSAGNIQIPDEVVYNSENQITIKFVYAFAGKAYLN